VITKVNDNIVNTISTFEAAGSAADAMSGGMSDSIHEATAATQEFSDVQAECAANTVQWSDYYANVDLQELVAQQEQAIGSAAKLQQQEQASADTIDKANAALQNASATISNATTLQQLYEKQLQNTENRIAAEAVKLQQAKTAYENMATGINVSSQAAEKQRGVVERLATSVNALTGQADELRTRLEDTAPAAAAEQAAQELGETIQDVAGSAEELTQQEDGLAEAVNEVNNSSSRLTPNLNANSGAMQDLIGQVGRLAATYLSLKNAARAVNEAISTKTQGLRFEALMGDSAGSAATEWAKATAKDMGREYSAIMDSTLSLSKMGFSGSNIQAITDLSDRLAWFTSNNDYDAISGAIEQAFLTGRTQSLSNALDLSTNALEGFGVKEAIEAGDMNGFIESLEAATEAAGMTAEAVEHITEGSEAQWAMFKTNLLSNVTDAASGFLSAFTPAFTQMNAWLQSSNAQVFFAVLQTAFTTAGQVAAWFVNILVEAANWIAENWQAVMMAASILIGIFAVKMLMAAASTMLANAPLLVLIGLAVAVGLALQEMGVSAEDVAGVIGGIIGSLVAFVYNRVVDIWNFIAMFVNFIGNCFNDPIGSLKVLFFELAGFIVGCIADAVTFIESLINKIPGVEIDISSGINGFRDDLAAAAQAAKDEMEWVEYVKGMDYMNYDDAWNAGSEMGKGLVQDISNTLEDLTNSLSMDNTNSLGDPFGDFSNYAGTGISDTLGSIDSSTANIEGAITDTSEDEIRYLKEIAERLAINDVTRVEVNIDMSGMQNTIGSDQADIDGFLNGLTGAVSEAFLVDAQGVHV